MPFGLRSKLVTFFAIAGLSVTAASIVLPSRFMYSVAVLPGPSRSKIVNSGAHVLGKTSLHSFQQLGNPPAASV